MAKIVYGVSGEGSGHSSRAREMLDHLLQLGHFVKVVSYDRGYRNLTKDFDVFETEGLHIASSDNRVSKVKTFTDNLQRLPRGHKRLNARSLFFAQTLSGTAHARSIRAGAQRALAGQIKLWYKSATCPFGSRRQFFISGA